MIGRILLWLLILVILILLAITGYAVLGDLSAPSQDVSKEVIIDAD